MQEEEKCRKKREKTSAVCRSETIVKMQQTILLRSTMPTWMWWSGAVKATGQLGYTFLNASEITDPTFTQHIHLLKRYFLPILTSILSNQILHLHWKNKTCLNKDTK